MTDREKAIVMAYTGICMLTGDKFSIFHKYVENIMGRPIFVHEFGNKSIVDEIREKSRSDFIALCADELLSEAKIIDKNKEESFRFQELKEELSSILKKSNLPKGCYYFIIESEVENEKL